MEKSIIVLGSGPGGYVAAIRAAQLGFKVTIVEKAEVGGVCLNWGCIPTKALLKSAQVFNYLKHAGDYGITINGSVEPDFEAIVKRSRGVAEQMNKGVQFLLKKNNITVVQGYGKVKPDKQVEVLASDNTTTTLQADYIILATGARTRSLPNLPQDGTKIIGYREAMTLPKLPKSMVVVGSGAIGTEFAFFYHSIGVEVTLVEFLPTIMPLEDDEISAALGRSFKKNKMKVMVESSVEHVDTTGDICKVTIATKKGVEVIDAEIVLSAVGIAPNIENIGLEDVGIQIEQNRIAVDDFYKTNVDGYYAIGDVVKGPALAHVASHEGIVCVEKLAGHNPESIDYTNIPFCTYCTPEIASVGINEKLAIQKGYEVLVGKFPFMASGKATAAGNRDGLIKVVIDKNTNNILGVSMLGDNVTEMIAEIVVARKKGVTGRELLNSIHPHPTMSEAVMEAVAAAYGEVIHL